MGHFHLWSDDAEKSWDNWDLGEIPENLEGEANSLRKLLQGRPSLKAASKDKRGWGSTSGSYSAADGYNFIQAILNIPQDPAQWKFVWSYDSIPKRDYFY